MDMKISRKKFRFQIAAGDRQLWAIGMVTAQWVSLDFSMKSVAHGLFGADEESRKAYDDMLVFRQRLRRLRELIDCRVIAPHRAELLRIIDQIGSIAQERDRLVHGIWSSDQSPPAQPDEPTENDQATHVSSLGKPKPQFKWRITYDRIVETAKKIDEAHFRLLDYLARAAGKPLEFRMSDALFRISRQPDQFEQQTMSE